MADPNEQPVNPEAPEGPGAKPVAPEPTPETAPEAPVVPAAAAVGVAEEAPPAPPVAGTTESFDPSPKPVLRKGPDAGGFYWGTGRRKSAVARVRVRPGSGQFKINKRDVDEYFTELQDRADCVAPLEATNSRDRFDVFVNVSGGGITGQAGAILLGLSRALRNFDASFEESLRDAGYLTRDARRVERKKYGQPGARRRFQFSKR